jgi:hypothetical protein
MGSVYSKDFFKKQEQGSLESAQIVVPILLELIPNINSVIDFGCWSGTWLHVFKNNGVREIKGVDGPWVKPELLKIPANFFTVFDFQNNVFFDKKYDLAVSLEVAEHLPIESAANFINSITQSADLVLFSAAIPFQGWTNHINEQWPSYWQQLFLNRWYVSVDFIRNKIWLNGKIELWYRQNIVLYVKKNTLWEKDLLKKNIPINTVLDFVHPDVYLSKNVENLSAFKILKILFKKLLK